MSYSTFANGEGLDSVRTKINAVIEGVNIIEPAVLGLGTAAQANVTASATDTTAGRLLKVGDYGLGRAAVVLSDNDVNNIQGSGFYLTTLNPTNMPSGWEVSFTRSMILQSGWVEAPPTGYTAQIAFGVSGNINSRRMAFRTNKVAGGVWRWDDWSEIYSTGNVDSVTWTTPTLLSGWIQSPQPLAYRVALGMLYIDGVITAGTKTDTTVIFNLPSGSRPSAIRVVPVGATAAGADLAARLIISPDGNVSIRGINASHNNVVINAVVRLA